MNNDGRYDLFIAKGNVDKMPDFAQKDPNNLLLQKADGNFMECGDKAGILSFRNHRGALLVDLNTMANLILWWPARECGNLAQHLEQSGPLR